MRDFPVVAHKKEQRGENGVDNHDQKNGHDHGAGRGASDFFGAGAGGEAFQASYGGNGDTKHDTLYESSDDITGEEGVKRGGDVTGGGENGLRGPVEGATEGDPRIGPEWGARAHER